MIKCDFCVMSKPNKNREMVCGYTIFDLHYKYTYCSDAIREMKKALEKENKKE